MILEEWTRAFISARGRGGKAAAAKQLGLTPSGLSHLLERAGQAFDDKTSRVVVWMFTSRAENFPYETYPVVSTQAVGQFLFEFRRGLDLPTWKITNQ